MRLKHHSEITLSMLLQTFTAQKYSNRKMNLQTSPSSFRFYYQNQLRNTETKQDYLSALMDRSYQLKNRGGGNAKQNAINMGKRRVAKP